jgi:hypothetical protein
MALQKPTLTQCLDGKEHAWLIVVEETDASGALWEHRWCQKCGGLTQVTYDASGQPIAVMGEDKAHFFMTPKILGLFIK